jgi:hypothetical protein
MSQSPDQNLIDRLNQHPKLRERMESLLNVVENVAGDCTRANDAERYVIEELRKMGNDALHCWGDKAMITSTEQLKEQQTKLQGHGKKSLLAFHLRRNRGY